MNIHNLFKNLIAICFITAGIISADGAYVVRCVKGNVSVKKGGATEILKTGTELKASDNIVIPDGAYLELTNTINNKVYSSTKPGTFMVSKFMLDAQKAADDHLAAVGDRFKIGGKTGGENRVYVEQGMVKRSLSEYDPEAAGFAIDPKTLARSIIEKRYSTDCSTAFTSRLERGGENALTLEVKNLAAYPLYLNIVTLSPEGRYSLSPLGQPAASYILLPNQTIMRAHADTADENLKQMVVVANCSFDVDLLLEELNKPQTADQDPLPDFPLYLLSF